MRVLVTGAAGRVARDLLPQLARRCDVRATDIQPVPTQPDFIRADLAEPAQLPGLMRGVDAVLHLGALLSAEHTMADHVDVNVKGTCNLLECAAKAGVRRFVYVGTVWATGHGREEGRVPVDERVPARPIESYGLTKLMAEAACEYYARMHEMDVLCLRFAGYARAGGFTDEGEIVFDEVDLPGLIERLIGAEGSQKFMDPHNLGEALWAAVQAEWSGFERVILGIPLPYKRVDVSALRTAPLSVVEKYWPGASAFSKETNFSPPPVDCFYDVSKAQQLLGWEHSFDLGDLMRWYREEGILS